MDSIINLQNDLAARIQKAKTNFKKSPKERITLEYINGRLESLEKLWEKFNFGHDELVKGYSPDALKKTTYVSGEVYDIAEDIYSQYKCELQHLLTKFSVQNTVSATCSETTVLAKLPKINIPAFSGSYWEWCTFKELFNSLIIKNNGLDNIQRLHYLKGYLVGEAEQIIKHIPIKEENFDRCWELLLKRYDNKRFISNHALKRLLSQRNLASESATGLKSIVDTTDDCLATLSNLGVKIETWDILIIHILTLKLDPETRRQWEFNVASSSEDLPSYDQFKNFLMNRFRALEFLNTKPTSATSQSVKVKSLHIKHVQTNTNCPYCEKDHKLSHCKHFQQQSVDVRRKFVFDKKLCFNCMGSSHSAKTCHTHIKCQICKRRHHSLLHPDGNGLAVNKNNDIEDRVCSTSSGNADGNTHSTPLVTCVATGTVQQQVLLATALVEATSHTGVAYKIRALLDQGSQSSFVTESTVQYLGLTKTSIRGKITGLGGDKQIISKAMVTIEIRSRIDQRVMIPVKAYVLKGITSFLPTRKIKKLVWPELDNLVLADPQYHTPNHIDMLLGAEVYAQILQAGLMRGPVGTIVAQATTLGWILSGQAPTSTSDCLPHVQVMHCCTEDNEMLKKFWEIETDVKQPKHKTLTEKEKRCEEYFAETTTRDQNGRYVVRLPFNIGTPEVTASKTIAERRLKSLENRLEKDVQLKRDYREVINEYLRLDHMEAVPEEEKENTKATYLPHHAVVRNDKETTKVRIVFDASCKGRNNLSLNDQLLVGPSLQPELRHIIMQWRTSTICMSADIVKMYRQVKVNQQDIDFQRILWRDNVDQEIKSYRLTRVTFGTASAPYLAVKALQQVVQDHGADYPAAAERVLKNFYVDDLLTGVQTVEEGKRVHKEMKELLGKAGFEIQKWNSNSDELVEAMKGTGKEEVKENLKIKEDELIKIMGLTWNRSDDTFRYVVNLPKLDHPVTKRRIISDISRLYDPLGWVGPSIILAKIMIQRLWLAGIDWDEEVPNEILTDWLTYRKEQIMFNDIRVPRWIGIKTNDSFCELHGFCDASKAAYAAVVYMRVLDDSGKVNVSLITAKTKVAPVKTISIPRLELCGAVLLCRLLIEVAQVFNVNKGDIHAWTDSTVVLAWLNNHPSKWNVFVANRVSEILTNLEPTNWCHVSSRQNPADCASRGVRPSDLVNNNLWFNGPEFLLREPITYIKSKEVQTDLEAVKVHFVCFDESIWNKYSSLTTTIRVMAYCRRFINNSIKLKGRKLSMCYLTAKELNEALIIWIKECQGSNFEEEIKLVKENKNLPKTSKLKTLNPFLDDEGVLRVGGRLSHSALNQDRKHPILIPKESHLTELIIAHAHKQTLHGGPQLTLTYIRSKYWIVGAKQLVKAHYRKCVICAKNAAAAKTPLMGELPAARVTPSRPFSHSGVDYAGPIQIRTTKGRGHKSYKGYICLFICMATRAIHLEVVSDLTSEGFLQAFKRFVARRGHCSHLWSDNGTNFIGAATEMQKHSVDEHKRMKQEVAEALAVDNCEWHFIPPHSPNFGGLWESGIKSVKYHLKRVIGNSTLTYEEMSTVLTQVEACLNSRPMSTLNDESDTGMVLTPGHFLIGEPPVTAPDFNFEATNVSILRRWQHTQRMLQSFWRQWSQEYLTKFLHRYKWTDQQTQPSLGDIVVIKEDNLPPCRWLYGRITATHPGNDNVIRVVTVRTKNGLLKRPVSKLCVLPVKQ